MTNYIPTYTRAELEAAFSIARTGGTDANIRTLSRLCKDDSETYHQTAARILAAHIGNVERRLTSDVEMEGLHHLWQHRGWSDAVKLLRGEDLP